MDSVDGTAVSRTEGRQIREPGKTRREVLTSVEQPRHMRVCVWLCSSSSSINAEEHTPLVPNINICYECITVIYY